MSTASQIYSALAGDAAVAALVGTRIYRNICSQDSARPFVLYRRGQGGGVDNTLDGPALRNPHYFVSCWADTNMDDAADLAEKVKAAILTAQPRFIFLADYDAEPEYPLNIYGIVLEFSVWEETD